MNTISWTKPDFETELEEFKRVSVHFSIPLEQLKAEYERSCPALLHALIWRDLENTDSNNPGVTDKLSTVWRMSKQYGKNLARVLTQISQKHLETPIILQYNNLYHLVSGNTRLTALKLFKIQPVVIIITLIN
jgi:hypothetical protein